jgi:hypothetical protein
VEIQIVDRYRNKLVVMNTIELSPPIAVERGVTELTFAVDALHLAPGTYFVNVCMGNMTELYDHISDAFVLEVVPRPSSQSELPGCYSLVSRAFHVVSATSDSRFSHTSQAHR